MTFISHLIPARLLLATACALWCACEPTSSNPPATSPDLSIPLDQGAPDAAVDTSTATLISGAGVMLTVQDFERAANRAMIFAPDEILTRGEIKVPRARLQRPFLQASVTRQLIEELLVEREAHTRGLNVTLPEIKAFVKSNEKLRRFAAQEDTTQYAIKGVSLDDFGLNLADLHDIARQQLLREKLTSALLTEIERQEVERAWQFSEDRAQIMFVRITNTPTSAEIDEFINDGEHLKDIEAHFASHQNRFLTPSIVKVDLLRAEQPDSLESLKAAAELLAKDSRAPADIAAQHGLRFESGQRLVRKEDPRAFAGKVDEVGVSMQAPRGDYVWVVREKVAASVPPLDRPLKREIAAILMRERRAVPSANARAVRVIGALGEVRVKGLTREALSARLERLDDTAQRRVKVLAPEWLQRDPSHFVRGVGTSETLLSAVFKLEEGKGVLDPAVPVSQYLWTGVLLARQLPDGDDFAKNYERYLAQYRDAIAPNILEMRFGQWQERDGIKADMDVLRDHFGAYEKAP